MSIQERYDAKYDGEKVTIWNKVNVKHTETAQVNGFNPVCERFDKLVDLGKGDVPEPSEYVTPDVAETLDWEFDIVVEDYDIEVLDPEGDEVSLL